MPAKSIFDKLKYVGIDVDQSRRHYPYFAVFDCESYLASDDLPKKTDTIHYINEHKLASISVCSNVAGYTEPINFVNDCESEFDLVSKMMIYLETLADFS